MYFYCPSINYDADVDVFSMGMPSRTPNRKVQHPQCPAYFCNIWINLSHLWFGLQDLNTAVLVSNRATNTNTACFCNTFNKVFMVTSGVTALKPQGKGVACHYEEEGQQIPSQTGSARSRCEVWFISRSACCQDFPKHRPYTTSLKDTWGMARGCGQRLYFMGHLKSSCTSLHSKPGLRISNGKRFCNSSGAKRRCVSPQLTAT